MKYQPYIDFTAQGANVRTLMAMYGNLGQAPDSAVTVIPIVVFMAFSIESYLNSIGSRRVPFWDEIERLPWRAKVNIIHKSAGDKADWGAKHLQFASTIFKLRDNLAHGKPEKVLGPVVDSQEVAVAILAGADFRPDWYNQLNKAWAMRAKSEFTELMQTLGSLHSLAESDHLASSEGGILQNDESN